MPKNLFCKSFLTIQCILDKKIKAIRLVDACAIRFGFIKKKFAKIVCERLEIQPQRLTNLKPIEKFKSEAAQPVTHAIYPMLSIRNHIKILAFFLIRKLEQYLMILDSP